MKYNENEMTLKEGALCLDFANTLDWRARQDPVELLPTYPSLVEWASARGFLESDEAGRLLAAAAEKPQAARMALQDSIDLREAVFRVLTSSFFDVKPQEDDLRTIAGWSARLLPKRQLKNKMDKLEWRWETPKELTDLLGPVLVSALDLITSPRLQRVGQCADDRGCGMIFLDLSRNRSRQWCSMEGCGNRAKARRHYSRAKQPEQT